MDPKKSAAEMTAEELELYVAENSQTGDPDNSLNDWIGNSDLSTETPDDVVAEWDSDR